LKYWQGKKFRQLIILLQLLKVGELLSVGVKSSFLSFFLPPFSSLYLILYMLDLLICFTCKQDVEKVFHICVNLNQGITILNLGIFKEMYINLYVKFNSIDFLLSGVKIILVRTTS